MELLCNQEEVKQRLAPGLEFDEVRRLVDELQRMISGQRPQ
jgi:hypothetical protein